MSCSPRVASGPSCSSSPSRLTAADRRHRVGECRRRALRERPDSASSGRSMSTGRRSRSAGRALAGLSMGGYGALNIGLHHPGCSARSRAGPGTSRRPGRGVSADATPATLDFNSPAAYAPMIGRSSGACRFASSSTGATGPADGFSPAFARSSAPRRRRAGTVAPPGVHDWRLWRAEMPRALSLRGTGSTSRPLVTAESTPSPGREPASLAELVRGSSGDTDPDEGGTGVDRGDRWARAQEVAERNEAGEPRRRRPLRPP